MTIIESKKHKFQEYERIDTVSLEEVLYHIKNNYDNINKKGKVEIKGHSVNVQSLRLRTFFKAGVNCSCCGIKGAYFAIERTKGTTGYHLNLWGINEDKEHILMTHDHKQARSLGGFDNIENTETMCGPCNWDKGKLEALLKLNPEDTQLINQIKNFKNNKERKMNEPIIKEQKELTPEELILLEKQIELEKVATQNCLLRVVAGSHAYGTNIPSSDWDERGIFVDLKERILLPFEKVEQVQFREDDIVYFELSKYIPLLLEQNPNVIELLWTEPKDILFISEAGQLLVDNRKKFLTSRIKDSYVGYAAGQLKRIKGHNKWINNPQPEREPEQQDFLSIVWNLSQNKSFNKMIPKENHVAVSLGDNHYSIWSCEKLGIPSKSWIDKRGNPNPILKVDFDKFNAQDLSPEVIVKVNRKLFEDTHNNWKLYHTWKNNRNEKRSALEALHGYDTKHAMHLIRLLRSGADILEHGFVPVRRPDFEYLLDIRNGIYSYDEIVKESERLSEKVNQLSKKTSLPSEPDFELAKKLMLEIYETQWSLSPVKSRKLSF